MEAVLWVRFLSGDWRHGAETDPQQTPNRLIRASGRLLQAFSRIIPPTTPAALVPAGFLTSTAITSTLACFILLASKEPRCGATLRWPDHVRTPLESSLSREARAGHTWLTRG